MSQPKQIVSQLKNVQWLNVILIIGIIITSLVSVFFLTHGDNRIIALWGRDFFYSIINGCVDTFADRSMTELHLAANYSLLTYVILALLYVPVYIVELISHVTADTDALMVYYNLWMVLLLIPLAKGLIDVFILKVNKTQTFFLVAFIMLSPVMQVAEIGKGQIDIIGLIFMVYAYKAYLQDDRFVMCILIGIGCLLKPYCILMFAPMVIDYILSNKFLEWLKGVLIVIGLYVIQYGLEYLLLGHYMELRKESDVSFLDTYFLFGFDDFKIYYFLTFLVLGLQFILRTNGRTDKRHTMIFASFLYVIMFSFTAWNVQYYSYAIIVFAFAFSEFYNNETVILFVTIFNLAFAGLLLIYLSGGVMEDMSIQTMTSVIGRGFGEEQKYFGDYIILNTPYYWMLRGILFTTLQASIIVILINCIMLSRGKTEKPIRIFNDLSVKLMGLCQVIPTMLFVLIAYAAQKMVI